MNESAAHEMDFDHQGDSGNSYEYLNSQLQGDRNAVQERKASEMDVRQQTQDGEEMDGGSQRERPEPRSKTIQFKKGEEIWEIPEDAIAEIKADKKLRSLMASEMRDKAAGDIAIQNRLRDLAEKRKDTEAFVKNFNKYSKEDPIKALEFAVGYASKENPDLNFQGFLGALADQATKLSEMSDAERKSYKLERDLKEKEEVLKTHEIEKNYLDLKSRYLEENDLSSREFDDIAQAILEDDLLKQNIKSEKDLIEAVEELHYNIEAQRVSQSTLKKFVPDLNTGNKYDEKVIIDFASILKDNPDFSAEDVEEIVYRAARDNRKSRASQTLSRKQRTSVSSKKYEEDNLSDYEYLEKQLLEDRTK